MLSPFSSPLLLVFLLLPANLLGRPNGGDLLASVKEGTTEDYEVSSHCIAATDISNSNNHNLVKQIMITTLVT